MESYFTEMPKLMEQAARNSASLWSVVMETAKTQPQTAAKN